MPTTQAAEGLARRRFTTRELEAMAVAGILADDERIELIAGEVVPMSPQGNRHEIIRTRLAHALSRSVTDKVRVSSEPQFNVSDDTHYVPDIFNHAADIDAPFVTGPEALHVIEIADTSLAYDLSRKATLYSLAGVREYWVIDAEKLITHVHRKPREATYAEIETCAVDQSISAQFVPALVFSLSSLDLPWADDGNGTPHG
ncbi:MAG: Uma2 family endonuclease [Pseudomonadota bacterium]